MLHVFSAAFILSLLVSGRIQVLTSQWQSQVCQTAPQVIYSWSLVNSYFSRPPSNETWPQGYKFPARLGKPLKENCHGTLKVPPSKGCCVSAVHPSEMNNGWTSSATDEFQSAESMWEVAPLDANGALYCHIVPSPEARVAKNRTLGYSGIWLLANGVCVQEEGVACSPFGELMVYSHRSNCTGDPETFALSSTEAPFSSKENKLFENMTASTHVVQGAGRTYSWVMALPIRQIVMEPAKNVSDALELSLFIIGLLCLLWVLYNQIVLYREKRGKRLLLIIGSQLIWIAWVVVSMWSGFVHFDANWDGTMFTLLNLASLSSVVLSLSFLLRYLNAGKKTRAMAFVCLGIVHLVLTGVNYFRFFKQVRFPSWWYGLETQLTPYWLFFVFFFDSFPPIFVILTYLRLRTPRLSRRFRLLFKGDPLFILGYLLQILVLIFYMLIDFVRQHTDWLGSDRAWVSMVGFITCCLCVHAVLTYVLVERMSSFVRLHSSYTMSSSHQEAFVKQVPTKR
ncbi:hypothetical protein HDV03_000248 [Kappamyces sp. JEL0829]|nr:hypothetical protein HDV03_000248 [Kappamyces sp. JEL0829]